MIVECGDFKPYVKNSLQGFAVLIVRLDGGFGLKIHDVTLNHTDDRDWVGLPSREYEQKGEKKWARIVDFTTRMGFYEFQTAALEAIRAFRNRAAK